MKTITYITTIETPGKEKTIIVEEVPEKEEEEKLLPTLSSRHQQIKDWLEKDEHNIKLPFVLTSIIFGYLIEQLKIELDDSDAYSNLNVGSDVYIHNQKFVAATISCNLNFAYILNVSFCSAMLGFFTNGTEFAKTDFTQAEFKTTYQRVMPDTQSEPIKFVDCLFYGTKFSRTRLSTQFNRCTIRQTIFGENCQLRIDKLEDCTVEETDFTHFDLSDTVIVNTKLFSNQFQKAILDNTILAGFSKNLLNLLAKSKNEYSLLLLLLQDYVGTNFLSSAYNRSKKIYWQQVTTALSTLVNLSEAKQTERCQPVYTDLLKLIETNPTPETGVDVLADRLGFLAAITTNLKLLTSLLPYMQIKTESLVKLVSTVTTEKSQPALVKLS